MSALDSVEEELLKLAKEIGPELIAELVALLKDAAAGKSADELKLKAEQIATLAAFKASYRA